MNNYKLINRLFANIEGIVVIPTLYALHKQNLLSYSEISLKQIAFEKSANKGYLNVAFSTLASIGILRKEYTNHGDIIYKSTNYGISISNYLDKISYYNKISPLIEKFIINNLLENDFIKYIEFINDYKVTIKTNIENLHDNNLSRFAHQLEGAFIYPIFLYNSYNDNQIFVYDDVVKYILSSDKSEKTIDIYNYLIEKSSSFGVTGSYQPIFSNLNKLIFDNDNLLYKRDKNGNEVHINRKLNVWGSGGSHKTYFKKIDSLIVDLFNSPLDTQPIGIADMGCGDGMFIKHLNDLIKEKTLRGNNLDKYPVKFIAADLNEEALESAKINLKSYGIECYFINADVSNPDEFKNTLNDKLNIDIKNLLHIRSFLDHNRIYKNRDSNTFIGKNVSICAFSYKGKYIASNQIKFDLISHFKSWKKYILKHGLLLLELHGLNKFNKIDFATTPSVAYEATHGYSDQYIVEYDVFLECAEAAGLSIIKKYSKVFPNENLVTISINIFK